ncbi:MAG TPA: NADH-quinone oxidoreductase subunit H [Bdellovibrionota bacterium]|nr:NADH-quinone oxidoreductase subunit H [Bdellovibrionota bacterium]
MNLVVHLAILFFFPPLLSGVIGKTKAWFGGRKGPPVLQPYFDLIKLVQKGTVYSSSTSWIFPAGPVVSLVCVIAAGLLIPIVSSQTPIGFVGDMILFAYLLGLGRFFIVLAAMDTGSSFEGMGASREATFSALVEPALILSLVILGLQAKSLTFAEALQPVVWTGWLRAAPLLLCLLLALSVVFLTENSRMPVDDPATHLELTMVHEVMVLDHSGVDLAFILYGSSIKLFLMTVLFVRAIFPGGGLDTAFSSVTVLLECGFVAVLVGVTESILARLRLPRIPQFLLGASALGIVGIGILFLRGLG